MTEFWRRRRTFVTGHTGFKGAWLSLWLRELGAIVSGYSLPPPTSPSLFDSAGLASLIHHMEGDVTDARHLRSSMEECQPEVVFHLAAQSLVRRSYEAPVDTFATNVMGTVNLLEAARQCPSVRAVVVVTTDKCYENREWVWPYRESDPLGGHDAYSASKACAELVTASYRRALIAEDGPKVASVRAGNVIGGGDWAQDRLVPDLIRALSSGTATVIRNPSSIRPWQHVTEPLAGYLLVAERLVTHPSVATGAWNFGPDAAAVRSVRQVADDVCRLWGEGTWSHDPSVQPHEARTLTLDSSKARAELGWTPRLDHGAAMAWTVDWYKSTRGGAEPRDMTLLQIRKYMELLQ